MHIQGVVLARISALGSARVPRVGCGVPPQRTFFEVISMETGTGLATISEVRFGGTPDGGHQRIDCLGRTSGWAPISLFDCAGFKKAANRAFRPADVDANDFHEAPENSLFCAHTKTK